MANKVHTHFTLDSLPSGGLAPKHLHKQEFGRRLYRLMIAKGWNQSELARRADIPRDSVSTYVRGKTAPTPQSVEKLARALGVEPAVLYPNVAESGLENEEPAVDMRVSSSSPHLSWLRVNRLVHTRSALKILEILEDDNAADAGRGGRDPAVLGEQD